MQPIDIGYFDPKEPIENAGGNLPHWRQDGVTYFVTFRLADALPGETLALWHRERADWHLRHAPPHTLAQRKDYHERFVVRFQKWLDAGHGDCVMRAPVVRQTVAAALTHFAGIRYALREWVIMPNHVHAVLTPFDGCALSRILQSWKSFTAKDVNQRLGRSGQLWQKESFDHIVRSPEQLQRIERYIHENPNGLLVDSFTRGCIHK
jgi:REP element-mobilizing transposase RayT